MLNTNQNLLFTATILALCIISFVHVFLFPLYDINARHGLSKTYVEFEQSLCITNIKRGKTWKQLKCPRYGIVTTMQGGRLGNQMWEYASVWALARRTGLEPYIPRCIRLRLDQVFDSLTVPTFEEIAHCPIDLTMLVSCLDAWNYTNQSIILPRYSVQPDLVLTWVQDIRQEFSFKSKLVSKSQQILHLAVKNTTHRTFVGVHVRRTDYIGYLQRKHALPPANVHFFHKAMKYFYEKYENVTFIFVSDDPAWCNQKFGKRKNVYVTSKKFPNSPAVDLAILAACNHSVIDYGTFGVWGAILAGGETIYYNLTRHFSSRVGHLLANWQALM